MTDDSHTAYEPHPTAAMDRQYRERDDEYAKLWQMYGELEDKYERLRKALIAQAKKTAYYNGAEPDAKAANLGFTYRWEEYLCVEARAALQEAL